MALSPQFTKKNGVAIDSCDNFNGLDNYDVLFANRVYPEMGFTMKIDTSLGDGSNLFTFYRFGSTPFSIFWDDQTANGGVTTAAITHTYSTGGQYEVACRGNFGSIRNSTGNTSREKLIDVLQWTANGGIYNFDVFRDCNNLVSFTATDAPVGVTTPATQTSFTRLFDDCDVWNGDLSAWDMSAATTFQEVFRGCHVFNDSSIIGWDTSNVTNMRSLFYQANAFNQNISGWDVSKVTNFNTTFQFASSFNQDLSGWDTSSATDMQAMFAIAGSFNSDLSGWNVSNVTNMRNMFNGASSFTSDLPDWDTSSCTDFRGIFANCPVGDLTNWDVSSANPSYGLSGIFQQNNTGSNPNLSNWKLPSVPFSANNSLKFFYTWTGGDLTEKIVNPGLPNQYTAWDMSQCTSMHEIFSSSAVFNGDCSNWNVGNCTDFSLAFIGTVFNQDISGWNVANATTINSMLPPAFSQDLSSWNVSNVTDMSGFRHSGSGDTTGWDVSSVVTATSMIMGDYDYGTWNLSSISTIGMGNSQSLANQAKTMEGWGTNALTNTGASAIPLYSNSTVFSKTATVGVQGYDGQAAYNGFLKLIAPTPNANRTSGTNTSTATDKLIDLGATFTASVNVGDVVANTTAGTYSEVVTVDSDTTLTLADDIFTSTSQAYSVDGGFGWTITGISFT